MEILGAYGKALADAGRLSEAAEVLKQAHTPDRPNWSILSAQGSVADQMGDHRAAQGFYREALKINPGEPSVLSNLGLSLALSKRLDEAEETLRQASAHPRADQRVRQNLALVLALQGKFTEAEMISARDVSPEQAAANVATIRQMISQSNAWREIQKGDPQTAPATGAKAGQRNARAAQADPDLPRFILNQERVSFFLTRSQPLALAWGAAIAGRGVLVIRPRLLLLHRAV
jgi:Tfp pilus assembly protein PilF